MLQEVSMRFAAPAAVCAFVWVASPAGSTEAPRSVRGLDRLDDLVRNEQHKDRVGGVSVGVVAGGRLVWQRTYGWADAERNLRATPNTTYRVASVTKQITALMLVQLAADGRLHLSDPVEKYLPEVSNIAGRYPGAPLITLVQLATMTAGLPAESDEAEQFNTGPVSAWQDRLLASLPHTRYVAEPGTRFQYSNMSYAILGAALARAAEEPYVDYVRRRITGPLGMNHTGFDAIGAIRENLARGYHLDHGRTDTATPERQHGNRGKNVPAGSLYSSVPDLALFVAFLLGHGPAAVLPTANLAEMFEGLVAADADLNYGDGAGFSALRLKGSGFVALGHLGALPGYSAAVVFDRPSELGVIVLANVTNGSADYQVMAQRALEVLVRAQRTGGAR